MNKKNKLHLTLRNVSYNLENWYNTEKIKIYSINRSLLIKQD